LRIEGLWGSKSAERREEKGRNGRNFVWGKGRREWGGMGQKA